MRCCCCCCCCCCCVRCAGCFVCLLVSPSTDIVLVPSTGFHWWHPTDSKARSHPLASAKRERESSRELTPIRAAALLAAIPLSCSSALRGQLELISMTRWHRYRGDTTADRPQRDASQRYLSVGRRALLARFAYARASCLHADPEHFHIIICMHSISDTATDVHSCMHDSPNVGWSSTIIIVP